MVREVSKEQQRGTFMMTHLQVPVYEHRTSRCAISWAKRDNWIGQVIEGKEVGSPG